MGPCPPDFPGYPLRDRLAAVNAACGYDSHDVQHGRPHAVRPLRCLLALSNRVMLVRRGAPWHGSMDERVQDRPAMLGDAGVVLDLGERA